MANIAKTNDAVTEKSGGLSINGLISTASKLKFKKEEKEILFAPIDNQDIEIKPTGVIYLPWVWFANRLNKAFGTEWEIIPIASPKLEMNLVLREYMLLIRGHLMGVAYGECNYIASNKQMSYGDAIEGTKSNALMRLCKGIGMGLELWQPKFVKEWIRNFAERYEYKDKNKKPRVAWRKKNAGTIPKAMQNEIESGAAEAEEIDDNDLVAELKSLMPKLPIETQNFIKGKIQGASEEKLMKWIKEAKMYIKAQRPKEKTTSGKKKNIKNVKHITQEELFNRMLKSHTLTDEERKSYREYFKKNPSHTIELMKEKRAERRQVETMLGFTGKKKCPVEIMKAMEGLEPDILDQVVKIYSYLSDDNTYPTLSIRNNVLVKVSEISDTIKNIEEESNV